MLDISVIDPNFKVETKIQEKDICFYDVLQPPFSIHGIFHQDGKFRRIPESVAKSVNSGVLSRHGNTAGGRIRFKTNSSYVAIYAKLPAITRMSHFALSGSAGFDLYVKTREGQRYQGTFVPPLDMKAGYESILYLPDGQMREFTVNMPQYSDVSCLYIGLQEGATLSAPDPYTHTTPIVYYGSSITQGGCASRPGNSYQNIITRRLDADYVNLGFSGSAKGEQEMAEYIAGLDMSIFVYDYDYNAPTVEHLQQTHEKFYLAVRKTHPEVPVMMLSRPNRHLTNSEVQRREIVQTTFLNAKARGENVYFISGEELMQYAGSDGTVDGVHPNDSGFASVARVLGDLLETIL